MAAISAAQRPWDEPFAPLPRETIVVVYNADAVGGWCETACREYCQDRGIPLSNLQPVHTGTIYPTWNLPGPTLRDRTNQMWEFFLEPIRLKLEAIGGNAIIYGPAVQTTVIMSVDDAVAPGAFAYPPLQNLGACARQCAALFGPNTNFIANLPTDKAVVFVSNAGGTSGGTNPNILDLDTLLGVTTSKVDTGAANSKCTICVPTYAQTAIAWDGQRLNVPYGMLGWTGSGPTGTVPYVPPPMNLANWRAFHARANAAFAALPADPAVSRAQLIFAQLGATLDAQPEDYPRLVKMMRDPPGTGWGLNVAYLYPENTTEWPPLPVSGAVATWAQYLAGLPSPINYRLQLGDSVSNTYGDASYGPPMTTNAVALLGGHSSLTAASNSWTMNQYAVAEQQAVAGTIDHRHRNQADTVLGPQLTWNLLRGMPALLSMYFAGAAGKNEQPNGVSVPQGDPLYGPFMAGAAQATVPGYRRNKYRWVA